MDFTKEILLQAIKEIDKNPNLKNKRNSSTYDLIYQNVKYPPILVLSIANKLKGEKELLLSDFNNNVEIPFKILRDKGFEIKLKSMVNSDNREAFKKWVSNNLAPKSNGGPSYMTSLDWLSIRFYEKNKIDKETIFQIEDIELISKLHKEVKLIQKDKTSYIYNKNAPSYGDYHFYSASLSKYKEFLEFKGIKFENKSIDFNHKFFHKKCQESGLLFSEKIVARFIASLCTKPFVICSGLSGSGKTKLAQAFVQWICESKEQYKIIPVGADWTNREPLLGYPNAIETEKYVVPENGALELIINAIENPAKPYFLILDEMNLSHVERYFADFLSAMESGEPIFLHTIDNKDLTIPQKIKLPKNLFIVGTVNIDETTYMFSPKVLDRANTIEFRLNEADLEDYFASTVDLDMTVLEKEGISMAANFVEIAMDETPKDFDTLKVDLLLFFTELKKTGAEFGYRTASEIGRLIQKLEGLGEGGNDLLDIAIMQKLLPKLHGSRSKLSKVLLTLGALCLENSADFESQYFKKLDEINFQDKNIKYKLSFEKIIRMYKNAMDNGFASYAEA